MRKINNLKLLKENPKKKAFIEEMEKVVFK